MGRRKIEIQPITHERNRSVTFLKRKNGLFKKAYELGVLCSVDVAIIIFNPAGTSNKLFEFTSTDLDSLIRRRAEFGGERDLKAPIDFTGEGGRPGLGKGNGIGGDSDEDEDNSDVPVTGSKSAAQSNKRRVSGTKSRPARNATLSSLHEEKPDIDELEHDTALSHSTAQRSPKPHLQVSISEDEHDHNPQERHRTESLRSTMNGGGSHRDQPQDGRGGESWPSPRSSNRQLPGYSNAHELLMSASGSSVLGNLGLPFSLGHLASQLTPQQLSSLAPHLSALASQQQLNSLSPQHQELLALHAVKQQQQQLHLQQREQLANIQNSLRGAPNRLATLNLNLSGLGNLNNFGGMGGLGNLSSLGGLGGDRELSSLGLGSSLSGLPIRKMGLGGANNFPHGLTSVSSSGTSGSNGVHSHGNSSASFNPPPLSSNNASFNSNGNPSHEQTPSLSNDDGSWLDFLSLPAGRIDPSSLTGLGPLSGLTLGGLVDRESRESAVRSSSGQSDAAPSLFGLPFGSGGSSANNSANAAYGSGVASGGGYGLGVGLGRDSQERRGSPLERSASRGESMDVDKDSARGERDQERRERSAERDRDDENHSRKRPRWE